MKNNNKFVSVSLGLTMPLLGSEAILSYATKGEKSEVKVKNSSTFLSTYFKEKFKNCNITKISRKIFTAICSALAICTGLRYIANSFLFPGSDCSLDADTSLSEEFFISKPIKVGDLRGRDFKLKNPASKDLRGKCVLLFSPNAASSVDIALDFKDIPSLYELLNRGATLIAVDYRGYGNSAPISRLKISEKTVYEDGEKIYDYARQYYKSEDIILFAHSMGGAVSSHVLAYASNKGENLRGIILASPINNLYSAAQAFTCKPLGALAWAVSTSELDTEKNLSMVKNKSIPIFLCSGDSEDVLSLERTKLHKKVIDQGFKNVTVNISKNCDHCDLERMFCENGNIGYENFDSYINKLGKN